MNKYESDKIYSKFLTKCIVCFSLLPVSCLLHILWLPFLEIDVIKNYAMELLVGLFGLIIGITIIILSLCAITYTILLVVKTIKQIQEENAKKLLKEPKFILTSILALIAIFFSAFSFFKLFEFLRLFI